MSAAILRHSSGALWRSDRNGGYNGFGTASGAMWRSDGNGGFNGFGPEIDGQMWRSDGARGFNGFGPSIEGQMIRSDGNGGFNGFGPGIEGFMGPMSFRVELDMPGLAHPGVSHSPPQMRFRCSQGRAAPGAANP